MHVNDFLVAELPDFSNYFQVMRFLVESSDGLAILEENHAWRFLVGIPKLRQVSVILLLDAYESCSILEKILCAKDVILNVVC